MFAQSNETPKYEGAGSTIEELLESHHVKLTRTGLEQGLRNADPEVRSLAAEKLAQDNDKESIPALVAALQVETVAQTRVNVAYALGKLGDERGVTALDSICADSSAEAFVKTEAARLLLYVAKGTPGCLTAMIEVLDRADISTRMNAASLLPQFHDLSDEESERVFQALITALKAEQAPIREAVSRALGKLANVAAVAYLQSALTTEPDGIVRSQIESSLQRLQRKSD